MLSAYLERVRHLPLSARRCIVGALLVGALASELLGAPEICVDLLAALAFIASSLLLSSAYTLTVIIIALLPHLLSHGSGRSYNVLVDIGLKVAVALAFALAIQWTLTRVELIDAISRETPSLLLDEAGRVVFISETAAEVFRRSPREMVGRPALQFVAPRYRPMGEHVFRSVLKGQPEARTPIYVVGRSGVATAISVTASALLYKGRRHILCRFEYMTGSAFTQHLFNAVFDGLQAPAAVRSPDGRLLGCNEAFARSTGRDREPLIGRRAMPFNLDPAILDGVLPRVAAGAHVHEEYQAPDGRTIALTIYPVLDHQGAVLAIWSLADDITKRKEAEKRLRRAERMAVIGQMAAGVTHNLNNILGAISMSAGLLELEPSRSDKAAADILAAVERGSMIVKSLHRLSGGDDNVTLQPVCVSDLFRSVVQLAGPHLAQQSIRVVQSVPAGASVLADANLIHQVLLNLVMNSIQAITGEGSISLTADAGADGTVLVRVTDTGCGIPPQHLEQLFTPFFTTKADQSGTGLGLSTSLSMMRAMGGDLRVEQSSPAGTTFVIEIPGV